MSSIKERLKNQTHRLIVLAAVAFVRTVEHLLIDSRSKDALDIAERFADGFATIEDVKVAEAAAAEAAAAEAAAAEAAAWAASASAASAEAAAAALWAAWAATASAASAEAWAATASWAATAATTRASSASESWGLSESTSHLILDCILPTRIKISFPIHVKGLANTIYDKKDFGLMLILADALEEMGQVDMALHCRCPIHVKGCWVLDSIMGK